MSVRFPQEYATTIAKQISVLNTRLISKVDEEDRNNKYMILSNFKGTYIEKQMLNEESIVDPIFRVFIPFKPERQRNININPENNFDPYIDSLMDYPTIIGHMLGQPWENYNRLISMQVPYCINECWHCYLPTNLFKDTTLKERTTELSAREIINKFYLQKKMDALAGKKTNVLRITGGEPFQLPSLILECLEILEDDKRSNFKNIPELKDILDKGNIEEYEHIFIWTETNLTPFISYNGESAFMDSTKNIEILKKLSNFNNFLVHPCFHGLDKDEYKNITHCGKEISLDVLINAIRKLVRPDEGINIDIYPTFGSNVSNPLNLKEIFEKLYKIDSKLPLRTALVEYKTDYEPIAERLKSNRTIDLFTKFANLRIWNHLLQRTYGIGYGTLPRHLTLSNDISINKDIHEQLKGINISTYEECIYLFKGSFRQLYHREVLDIMAYPINHNFEVEYEAKWIQEDFFNHIKNKPLYFNNKKGVFLYVDKKNGQIFPIRKFELIGSSVVGSILKLNIKLLEFITISSEDNSSEVSTAIQELFYKYFGKKSLPPSNFPFGKYLLYGESFYRNEKISFAELSNKKLSIKEEKDFDGVRKNIDSIVKSGFMQDSLHYHLNPIDMKILNDSDKHSYFEIKSGKNFTINIENYLPNYQSFEDLKAEERNIKISISKDCVELMGSNKYNCPKYGTKNLVFNTKSVKQEELVIIKFHSENREFKCANVEIRVKVVPLNFNEALKTTLVSLGLLLWMSFGSMLVTFNATSSNTNPVQQFAQNIYNKDLSPSINLSFISYSAAWVFGLLLISYLIAKLNFSDSIILKRLKSF